MMHFIKCQRPYFEAAEDGSKRFEYRKNDRQYHVGDHLTLVEIDEAELMTGRQSAYRVLYILQGVFGLPDGYCIMSIERC